MKNLKYVEKIGKDTLKQLGSLGSSQFFIVIVILFFLLDKYNESLKLFLGFVSLYIIASPLRIIFFRERPEPKPYLNIVEKINASSFPSLHSARSVFLALFLSSYFNYELKIVILLLLIVIIIMISRLYRKRHYVGDLVAGAILGTITFILLNIRF